MTDTLKHDITRYTVAVEKSRAWIAAREEKLGVAGLDADDFRYPVKLAEARAKLAELEAVLSGMKAPIAEDAPTRIGFGTPLADHVFLDVGQVHGQWFSTWTAYLGIYGHVAAPLGEGLPLATEAEAVEGALRQIRHWLEKTCGASGKSKEAAYDWLDGVAAERGIGLWTDDKTPKPARKPRRHAPDPVTDADRATTIVMKALRDTVRPGAPLPIIKVEHADLWATAPSPRL